MDSEITVRQIDDLTVDLARRKIYDHERNEIVLSALSFDSLRALIDAAPAALSADELIARAWRGTIVSDDAVTQRIRLLRKALGDNSKKAAIHRNTTQCRLSTDPAGKRCDRRAGKRPKLSLPHRCHRR